MKTKYISISLAVFSLLVSGCGQGETTSSAATTSATNTSSSSSSSTSSYVPGPDQSYVQFFVDSDVYFWCQILKGEKANVPQDPVKVGYSFQRWLNEDGTPWDSEKPITTNTYNIYAEFDYDFLELPAVIIKTENGQEIVSKDEYVTSAITITNTKTEWELDEVAAGVKGRGNTTWGLEKKPYRIKFDSKQKLFGSSYKAKSWTLLANYSDKSLLRNFTAFELGERFDGIDFSSKHQLVDLYINNDYKGVYLVCDQIQTGSGRVNINESVAADGNNGYLIERDARASSEGILDQDYFIFNDEEYVFKTPDSESQAFIDNKDVEIQYIRNYLTSCQTAITEGEWSNVESLIDIDSFVDSYIVEELFANNDCGYSSCYYYKDKNGKLFKGPLWDFDIAAGNVNYNMGDEDQCLPNETVFASKYNFFYKILMERNEFVALVKNKLIAYETTINEVLGLLDVNSEDSIYSLAKNALERNFDRWEIMGKNVWPEPNSVIAIKSLSGQIKYLRSWLQARYAYLNDVFAAL